MIFISSYFFLIEAWSCGFTLVFIQKWGEGNQLIRGLPDVKNIVQRNRFSGKKAKRTTGHWPVTPMCQKSNVKIEFNNMWIIGCDRKQHSNGQINMPIFDIVFPVSHMNIVPNHVSFSNIKKKHLRKWTKIFYQNNSISWTMSFVDSTEDDYRQMIVILVFIAREFDVGWNRDTERPGGEWKANAKARFGRTTSRGATSTTRCWRFTCACLLHRMS